MMSRVARWISGQSVATPSSTTLTRYSRWRAPITVASTQISVIVPVTTSDVTPRARSAPSSSVPANPSYPRFRKTGSSGPGASAGTVSALGVPSRQEDEGRPKPRGAPGGAGRVRWGTSGPRGTRALPHRGWVPSGRIAIRRHVTGTGPVAPHRIRPAPPPPPSSRSAEARQDVARDQLDLLRLVPIGDED